MGAPQGPCRPTPTWKRLDRRGGLSPRRAKILKPMMEASLFSPTAPARATVLAFVRSTLCGSATPG